MNELYPIFLKADQINILLIGGGSVGAEKLHFLLKSSPQAKVEIVSESFDDEVIVLAQKFSLPLFKARFKEAHLNGKTIVIAATNDLVVNEEIYERCREKNILVNVADNPDLCDFYLGGIVTKGNLKIAISTNGKSPTMAKRMRQYLEAEIPDDIDELLENLRTYRQTLNGDFTEKINRLNELTKNIIEN
ncbi:MAG: bifunctional precorrin-2 dehydrogenase/sirohydrochlorin ferrochelatase [Crocinitomicaceae bacterium]|nr:bifunctional precorrin-2 dehydrogenase/sirohydrochlorin ferrochelatase [Crocinitomicaceae bacterium]